MTLLRIRNSAQSTGIALLCLLAGMAGCGDDDQTSTIDASVTADASTPDGAVDAGDADAGADAGDEADAGPTQEELVARGTYLVEGIGSCPACHTSTNPDGSPDTTRFMGGNPCLVDIVPDDDSQGCLATPNLTNHPTGLANRTDDQIKTMFQQGMRPDGRALHPFMPYWVFANLTDQDADAIVAYLRTLPGVDHTVPPSQGPAFLTPPAPARVIDMAQVPTPDQADPNHESAMRGRYLAAGPALCIECHTQDNPLPPFPAGETPTPEEIAAWEGYDPVPFDRLFQGNRAFGPTIFSRNLTPDEDTGLGTWTTDQIVTTIRTGVDPDGNTLCPPMRGFVDMTEQDARDIAHYLQSLAAGANDVPESDCSPAATAAAGAASVIDQRCLQTTTR